MRCTIHRRRAGCLSRCFECAHVCLTQSVHAPYLSRRQQNLCDVFETFHPLVGDDHGRPNSHCSVIRQQHHVVLLQLNRDRLRQRG